MNVKTSSSLCLRYTLFREPPFSSAIGRCGLADLVYSHICPVCALSIWTSAAKDAHTHDPSETTQGEGQDECDSDQDFELDGDVYLMEVAGQLDPETSHDSASEGEWESDEDTGEYSEAESAVEDGSRGDDDEDQSGSVEGHGRSSTYLSLV